MIAVEILLVLLGASLAYAWLLYPIALRLAARAPRAPSPAEGPAPASVAVVLSAYNEEDWIAARIANLLAEAPVGVAYAIHVGVDACSDGTAERARAAAAADPRVHVHAFPQRRGKVAVLKDLVAACHEDILVFTDANTLFEPGAMRALLAPLRDPRIGAVCGRLALVSRTPPGSAGAETDAATQEGFYWRWETTLKTRESAVDSCLGVNGGIFAMRRPLFWSDIPDNTMVDDFVIGMKVREQGYRVCYEPRAAAVEELPEVHHEWTRRVRIGAGDYQALMLCRRCLGPRYGRFAWIFWSHKVLRWLTPHIVLVILPLALAAAAAGSPAGRWLGALALAVLALFVVMALLGVATRGVRGCWARIPALFLHYVTMQAALFAGFLRFIAGNLSGHWTRTPRMRTDNR